MEFGGFETPPPMTEPQRRLLLRLHASGGCGPVGGRQKPALEGLIARGLAEHHGAVAGRLTRLGIAMAVALHVPNGGTDV